MATKKKSARKKKSGARKAGKKAPAKKKVAKRKAALKKPARRTSRTGRAGTKKAGKKVPAKRKSARPSAKRPRTLKAPAPRPRKKTAKRVARNAAFFEHFRQRLLAEREQISRRLDELREELRGLDETPREMEEWAQEEKDRDILIRLEERETDELRKIQAALTLIDQKEYGKCQACGRAIPRARLEELPTAFRCVDCTP